MESHLHPFIPSNLVSAASVRIEGPAACYDPAMAFWTYILRCADGSYYTGHTDNLEQRLAQHDQGTFEGYTHLRRPLQLVYSQESSSREQALAAEMQIKGWSRRKKEALIKGDWAGLSHAARKGFKWADPPF